MYVLGQGGTTNINIMAIKFIPKSIVRNFLDKKFGHKCILKIISIQYIDRLEGMSAKNVKRGLPTMKL